MTFSALDSDVPYPKGKGYPENPQTIGEQIRKVRMDKRLLQKDVAEFFKISEDCVTYWENNRSEPLTRHIPLVIAFLGYDPYVHNLETVPGKLRHYRLSHGLTHKAMGKLIGVDASTIGAWESEVNRPLKKHIPKISQLLNCR